MKSTILQDGTLAINPTPEDWTENGTLICAPIIEEARKHGFEINETSLLHNLEAWRQDYKSCFIINGARIFTPCGCNRLVFRIDKASDSDFTYIA